MGIVSKGIGELLQLIYNIVGVYGIAIVILTVIVKVALYPLYAMQTRSTMGMADIQPKVQEIQRRYANDRETMNLKVQELYKQEKINPAAGCLPMIIQLPIIWGLFSLMRRPLTYMGTESDILFAVHEQFLWITDLTQPDKWILPLAAGIATYFSFAMTQKLNATPGNNQAAGMMKGMQYIFPVMIIWLARTYPAGLSVYWFISQLIQILINIRLASIRKKHREEVEFERMKK